MSSVKRIGDALVSGAKHFFHSRMTLRYPEQKLSLHGEGYKYDPRQGVGIAGYKGRHILFFDKCTGCQLCAIACENISHAIDMVKVEGQYPKNKKSIFPQVDYGECVFCGFCVDACPFDALYMTNDYELSAYDRRSLVFTPKQLAIPPQGESGTYRITYGSRGASHG